MKSIRVFLIIVLLSSICLVNFIAALHGYHSGMNRADALLDRELAEAARTLEQLARHRAEAPVDIFGENSLYQVWSADSLLLRSSIAPDTPLADSRPDFHTLNYRGLRWRILVATAPAIDGWIVIGQRYDIYTGLVEQMIIESIAPVIWVLPLLGLLIWLIVSRGLSPLKKLATVLSQRKQADLAPVATAGYPAELAVVVTSINNLLRRLAAAFAREKRFSADAAHELRTPLAAVKVSLHNLRQEQQLDEENIAELEAGIDRMSHSIEQILSLYRLTPEKFHDASASCDLEALAQEVIVDLYDRFNARQQKIGLQSTTANTGVEGDDFALQTLLRNLLLNAGNYTPEGGEIAVTLAASGNGINLVVEDSGPGIEPGEYHRVLDRFYRAGGDQHSSGVSGCGLGLSIVDHIVKLHQGRLTLSRSATLGGLAVTVWLPLRQPDLAEVPA